MRPEIGKTQAVASIYALPYPEYKVSRSLMSIDDKELGDFGNI